VTRRATPVSDAELHARAAELAIVPEADHVRDPDSRLIVRIRGGLFSIAATSVREIVPHPIVTPLPTAPPFVAGVMNLRGEIVAVIDASTLLGIDAAGPPDRFGVVIEHHDLHAALLVDRVEDMLPDDVATPINVQQILHHPALLQPDEPAAR
jgi:purine-binding chemotaxis protein CheW